MKTIKSAFYILLMVLFNSSKTCDGQFSDIIFKGAGIAIKIMTKAEDILRPFIKSDNETIDEYEWQNQKLDNIISEIQQMKEDINMNFKVLLGKVYETSSKTASLIVANQLETSVIGMRNEFEDILQTAKKVKKRLFKKDDYIVNKLSRFSNKVDKFKTSIRSIVNKKKYSMDYLDNVKAHATNVCRDRMTQLQALDIFRALYVETMMKYLISEHLIISMYELLGTPDTNNEKKTTLNEVVQKYLNKDLTRFQEIMASASREFQTCTKPSVFYETGTKYTESSSCYIIDPNDKYQPSVGSIVSLNVPNTICVFYFSLRPTNAEPGYVVIGAKIQRKFNVLYVRVLQGKLLPNGLIDLKSISYNDDPEDVIGDSVVKIWYRETVIDLTETIVPDNRVITGLRFAQSSRGHMYLEVTSTEINLKEGLLNIKTSRPENHKDGTLPYEVRKPNNKKNNETVRSHSGLQVVEPDRHVKLAYYLNKGAHPYVDGDEILPIPLTLLSGASLYVKEVPGELGFLSIRFKTFNIVPHLKIELDVNQNFTDIINKI